MANKKSAPSTGKRPAAARTTSKTAPEQSQAAAEEAAGKAPPGLDEACHTTAQCAARQAQVLREAVFPMLMAGALRYDSTLEPAGYQAYLEQLLVDSGNPTDPVEVMMVQQLALAHYRIAQLHSDAAHTKSIDAVKAYNGAAARLWGEFRRTALALRIYRGRGREDETKLKIYKMAQ